MPSEKDLAPTNGQVVKSLYDDFRYQLWRQIKTHEYTEQIQVLGHCGEAVTQ